MKNGTDSLTVLLWRELVRDRVFWVVGLAVLVLIGATLVLNEMVVGEALKATKDFGLTLLNLFAVFVVIVPGIGLLGRDLSQKTLYFLFAKPITRQAYLRAAAAAVFSAAAVGILALAVAVDLLSRLQGEGWLPGIATAAALTLLETAVLTAFAVLFAVLTSPVPAMFLTALVYVAGHTVEHAWQVLQLSGRGAARLLGTFLYWVLPNLEFFNRKADVIQRQGVSAVYFAFAVVYALCWTVLVFMVARLVFARREL